MSARPGQEKTDRSDHDRSLLAAQPDVLETLIHGVAHDLNNLTTAIRTSVDTLRFLEEAVPELDTPSIAREQLDRIERAAMQSSALMNILAAFGQSDVHLTAHDLSAVLETTGQFLRRVLSIEVDVATSGPGGSPGSDRRTVATVLTDPAQLARALFHLCGAAPRSHGRVRLGSTASNGRELSVEISSPTIEAPRAAPSEADLDRARSLLSRCGAALSFSYADARGGWTGTIRLPEAPSARSHRGRGARSNAVAARGVALVAEDHTQVRDALVDALNRCGFEVETVQDGDALVDRALESPARHDVLLIDYDLPGRTGAEALEAIRAYGIEVPALMISGNVDFRPSVERMFRTDFMQKPFGLADIREWATGQVLDESARSGEDARKGSACGDTDMTREPSR